MELVVERRNVEAALQRVRRNKGRPGVDGVTVEALPDQMSLRWEEVRAQLLAGPCARGVVRAIDDRAASDVEDGT